MRLSRLGIIFCLLYLLPTIACVALGLSSDDNKSSFVLFQLPLAVQLSALKAAGFREALSGLSWPGAYLLLCSPVIVLFYCVGWWLGRLFKRGSNTTG